MGPWAPWPCSTCPTWVPCLTWRPRTPWRNRWDPPSPPRPFPSVWGLPQRWECPRRHLVPSGLRHGLHGAQVVRAELGQSLGDAGLLGAGPAAALRLWEGTGRNWEHWEERAPQSAAAPLGGAPRRRKRLSMTPNFRLVPFPAFSRAEVPRDRSGTNKASPRWLLSITPSRPIGARGVAHAQRCCRG